MPPSAALAPPAPPTNVGVPVVLSRETRDGRRLWYETKVLQQPERARACGSGPKSSADRRPIDPPPVVQINIYEGPSIEQGKDITFSYSADFFLFAHLEHAPPKLGRAPAPNPTTPPVLTGMPVSSVCYLDRPVEAGYFLFPDLSVRHEGQYRITFSLMEETKEDRDKDPEPTDQGADEITGPESRHYAFRMTVPTDDFSVYSAKKFPGLTESTALSRTVAEQGCRVRIRRDVRMRKRPADKPRGAEDVDAANDHAYNRRRSADTLQNAPNQQPRHYRPRSPSQIGMDRIPYGADPQRRHSGSEYVSQSLPYPRPEASASQHHAYSGPPPPHGHYPHQQPGPSIPPSPSYPSRIASVHYERQSSVPPYHQQPSPSQQYYQSSPLQQQFPASSVSSIKRESYSSSNYARPPSSHYRTLSPATRMEVDTVDRNPPPPTRDEKCPSLPSLTSMYPEVDSPPLHTKNLSIAERGQHHRPSTPYHHEYRTLAPVKPVPPPSLALAAPELRKRKFEAYSPPPPERRRFLNGQRENSDARPDKPPYKLSQACYDRASGTPNLVSDFPGVLHPFPGSGDNSRN